MNIKTHKIAMSNTSLEEYFAGVQSTIENYIVFIGAFKTT